MKTSEFLKREWVFWILILAPFVFGIIHWNDFGDKVPIHWNVEGEVDNTAGKWAVFLSPLIGLGTYFLMLLLPKIDPRKKNYDLFTGAYWMIRVSIALLFCVIGFVSQVAAMGIALNVGMIVMVSILTIFMIMGNQFGKIRPNYFVGIRTPWTINNSEVWTKTHRLAGRIWVAASAGMLILVFLLPKNIMPYTFFAYIFLIAAVPIIYSWKISQGINKNPQH